MIDQRERDLADYDRVTHAAYRILAEWSGGAVVVEHGVMLASGPDPDATIVNAAFRLDPSTDGETVLRLARAHYEPIGFRFAVNATAHRDADLSAAAAASGWQRVLHLPAMVLRQPIAPAAAPGGAALRQADPDVDGGTFGRIAGICFADDAPEERAYGRMFTHRELLGGPGVSAFVASLDGEDAAIAWSVVVDHAATVGWVGTLPQFRRRGLGELVTRAATNAAFDRGARLVTLQASPSGAPVYAAMGYEAISSETIWIWPTA